MIAELHVFPRLILQVIKAWEMSRAMYVCCGIIVLCRIEEIIQFNSSEIGCSPSPESNLVQVHVVVDSVEPTVI